MVVFFATAFDSKATPQPISQSMSINGPSLDIAKTYLGGLQVLWGEQLDKYQSQLREKSKTLYFWICFGEVCMLALNHYESSEDSWIQLSLVPNHWWLQYCIEAWTSPFHTREPLQFSNWCRSISQSAKIALLLEGWHVGKGTLRSDGLLDTKACSMIKSQMSNNCYRYQQLYETH